MPSVVHRTQTRREQASIATAIGKSAEPINCNAPKRAAIRAFRTPVPAVPPARNSKAMSRLTPLGFRAVCTVQPGLRSPALFASSAPAFPASSGFALSSPIASSTAIRSTDRRNKGPISVDGGVLAWSVTGLLSDTWSVRARTFGGRDGGRDGAVWSRQRWKYGKKDVSRGAAPTGRTPSRYSTPPASRRGQAGRCAPRAAGSRTRATRRRRRQGRRAKPAGRGAKKGRRRAGVQAHGPSVRADSSASV